MTAPIVPNVRVEVNGLTDAAEHQEIIQQEFQIDSKYSSKQGVS